MMRLCHGLLHGKEEKISCNIFTAAGTVSPSSHSPGALKSSLKQSDSQQNPNLNASLDLGKRGLKTEELLMIQEEAQHN